MHFQTTDNGVECLETGETWPSVEALVRDTNRRAAALYQRVHEANIALAEARTALHHVKRMQYGAKVLKRKQERLCTLSTK